MKKFGHPPIVALSMQKILTVLANKINNHLSNQLILYLKLSTENNWMINLLTKSICFSCETINKNVKKTKHIFLYVLYSTVQCTRFLTMKSIKAQFFSIPYRVFFLLQVCSMHYNYYLITC